MTQVPIFEAKNKLPLFIHQAEDSGPIFISRRNKNVAVLISFDSYNRLVSKSKKPNIIERAKAFRERTGWNITNEEVDEIFANVRDTTIDPYTTDVYEGVFDD